LYRYYPYSCTRIERALRGLVVEEIHPRELSSKLIKKALRDDSYTGLLAGYLLWMLQQLQAVRGRSSRQTAKRGRWMGWVYGYCEWMGLFTQRQVRNMCRRDVHARRF